MMNEDNPMDKVPPEQSHPQPQQQPEFMYVPTNKRNVQEAGYYLPSGIRMPNGGVWTGPKKMGQSRLKRTVLLAGVIVLCACIVLGLLAAFADSAMQSSVVGNSHLGVGLVVPEFGNYTFFTI